MTHPIPAVGHDVEAIILTGHNWSDFILTQARKPHTQLLLSCFMVSPWWLPYKAQEPFLTHLNRITHAIPIRRCLLGDIPFSHSKTPFNQSAAKALTEAGWQVRHLKDNHEKVWIIGHSLAIVGSHNVSYASATKDQDTSIALFGITIAAALETRFWSRWARGRAITH